MEVAAPIQNRTIIDGPNRPEPIRSAGPALCDDHSPGERSRLSRDTEAYKGDGSTRAALGLSPILFQRPGQLSLGHWEDIDSSRSCGASGRGSGRSGIRAPTPPSHYVPLPRQPLDVLLDLHPLTGPSRSIFRSMVKRSEATRYMSDIPTMQRCGPRSHRAPPRPRFKSRTCGQL